MADLAIDHFLFSPLGSSVSLLIIFVGVISGIGASVFNIYTMNLVGRGFKRFRPIAISFVNLGAPIGSLLFPYVARDLLIR